ncbi:MAG: hypothetical protein US96_C0030G0010 [Candidatus Woesebacteria bacterium GW2011_GWB1_38_5b]|uniref:Uncharacterized protein n=1 Tax=Candidatus Woesebacteria bacterium GW2011_GWB1_38_5b TaxID=1618569 RepID=A0A0G0KG85_9BACT|nr:MAG: hypothetical protein US96_C0030G0010 [Candidatus Woesebacteria bacterium GW2011_GWB1_38_5b]
MENDFCEYIKEELDIWVRRKPPFSVGAVWHVSENFVEGPKGNLLVTKLYSDKTLNDLYKTEERLKKIISRAFNVYINILFEKNKNGYYRSIATWVFKRWIKEINSASSQAIVLAPVINLRVDKKIQIGEIELYPIKKSGTVVELESQIHNLLGYPKKRNSVMLAAFSQAYFPFFMHASALKIEYSFKKPDTFFDYTSWPPPNYQESVNFVNSFILLLRLFKDKDLRVENYFSALASLFVPSAISYSGNLGSYAGEEYTLVDQKEINRLRAFYKKILPTLLESKNLPMHIQIGIEYFNSSFQKTKTHERFIDLMISLDALFGVKYETTYRVPLRIACFLEKETTKRIEMRNEIEQILRLRGGLFHGDVHPQTKEREIANARIYVENIVRKSLVKLLTLFSTGQIGAGYKDTMEVDYIL